MNNTLNILILLLISYCGVSNINKPKTDLSIDYEIKDRKLSRLEKLKNKFYENLLQNSYGKDKSNSDNLLALVEPYGNNNYILSKKANLFTAYRDKELTPEELRHNNETLLNILTPPVVIRIGNNNINLFRYSTDIEALAYENSLKELSLTPGIRKYSTNPTNDYLSGLCFLLGKLNENHLSSLPKETRNIIDKYQKAIDYYFLDPYDIEGKEAARQIIEYREKLGNEKARKYIINFSLEEIQKMVNDSHLSAIVYKVGIYNGESYLYPDLIISETDNDRYEIR